MFELSFGKMMIIAVVALIVLGPEKLPKTARTLGHLFGRLQRYVGEVKADINRELAMDDLKKLQAEVSTAAADFQSTMTASAKEVEDNIRSVEASLNASAAGETAPVRERGAAPEPLPETLPPVTPESPARDSPQQAALPGFERG